MFYKLICLISLELIMHAGDHSDNELDERENFMEDTAQNAESEEEDDDTQPIDEDQLVQSSALHILFQENKDAPLKYTTLENLDPSTTVETMKLDLQHTWNIPIQYQKITVRCEKYWKKRKRMQLRCILFLFFQYFSQRIFPSPSSVMTLNWKTIDQ